MTREEAIQRIKANMDAMYYFPETIEAFNMAIEALQEPKTIITMEPPYRGDKGIAMLFKGKDDKLILEALKELPSAEAEWIPCSERLPEEENKSYWICTDGGYQCECRWTNVNHFWTNLTTDWHWHIMDVPQYSKVVAWMPLPEPYGGEQDGN